MSDRNVRPEWRTAYLNRTVTHRAPRDGATAPGPAKAAARGRDGARASQPLPIAAMLRLLPTA